MEKDSAQMLWDMYPVEEKANFFPAYIYLKYIDYFMDDVQRAMNPNVRDRREDLDPTLRDFLEAYRNIIGLTGGTRDTNIYHSKVVKVDEAVQFVNQKKDLTLKIPEKVVPFKIARDVILRNPESIALGTCVCRASADTSCVPSPMEVCLFVGDPVASFIADHNPLFRRCTQEEAVHVIDQCHEKGFVQTAWFKGEMGNRFSAICNCCSCHCMGIKAVNMLGMGDKSPFMAPSGYLAHVNNEACTGCGECVDTCQFKALSLDEEKDVAVVTTLNCLGCGVCEDICPAGAITLEPEPSKCEPLNIEKIVKQMEFE